MDDKKIVSEHDDIHEFTELLYRPSHDKRTESAEFRETKHKLHAAHTPCFINNGHCHGQLEVHHFLIEWSESNAIDWEKVKQDNPKIDDVDDIGQMMVLCEKHHRGKYTGIHEMTYSGWILQKYMTPEALDKFETAVAEQLAKDKAR